MRARSNQCLLNKQSDEQPWEATVVPAVAATGTLTMTGSPLDGEVIVVGGFHYIPYFYRSGGLPALTVGIGVDSDTYPNLTDSEFATAAKEFTNAEASSQAQVTFGFGFGVPVTAEYSGAVITVTSPLAGGAGNATTTTTTLTNGSWGSATLTGGIDERTTLQPADSSLLELFKTAIWRCFGRFFTINLSSEKTDLYWEESGATIIPKSI